MPTMTGTATCSCTCSAAVTCWVSHLRPSEVDEARLTWGIQSLLFKALRAHWLRVAIMFRGDNGFCRWRMLCWRMLRWCAAHGVG